MVTNNSSASLVNYTMQCFSLVIDTDRFEETAFFHLIKYSIISISIIIQPVVTVNRAFAASGSPNTNI